MFSRRRPEVGQEALHRLEHGVVAAAGAPAHLLVGGEVLAGLRLVGGRHLLGARAELGERESGGRHDSASSMASSGELAVTVSVTRPASSPSAWATSSPIASASSPALSGRPWTLVVADDVDEVARAQQQGELAEVHLGHEHLVVARQDLAEVVGERVEVAQVHLGDVVAGLADPAYAGADRTVGRAPAQHQHLAPCPPGSSTSSGGSESAIRSILAWRVRTIKSWLAGS